ncbi:MAG: hypothetical protein PGN34_06800 [Methylobacterium frigidaeris]
MAEADDDNASLPEPVRTHLGQQLRSVYNASAEKPQYLGDPVLPPELSPHLRRLETRLKAHETGTGAVEDALKDLLGQDPAGSPPGGRSRHG